jgi:hypothetical protein
MLLAAGAPGAAQAESAPPDTATWQLEGSALLYGEVNRADVVEPVARATRLFPDGQSLTLQLGLDAITGASPSGAMPPGRIQTTTSSSGMVTTLPANRIPTTNFKDFRTGLDLEWLRPMGRLLSYTTGAHFSREKDYQSLGASGKLALDLPDRLTTLTVGIGLDHDGVFPVGGTPPGLSDGTTVVSTASNAKRVSSGMVGISRVLTRRWMVSVNASRTRERGYLTEPYKVVSLVDPTSGETTGQLTERRPPTRDRTSIFTSSVYHLTDDVVYLSHRYYTDDWGVRSNTIDLKYRRELGDDRYLQPHLRYYSQTRADFFTFGLPAGTSLPEFATSDFRLGALRTVTFGATYGFRIPNWPGQLSARGEFLVQWGNGHPPEALGIQRQFDLFPPLGIGSLLVGYSIEL